MRDFYQYCTSVSPKSVAVRNVSFEDSGGEVKDQVLPLEPSDDYDIDCPVEVGPEDQLEEQDGAEGIDAEDVAEDEWHDVDGAIFFDGQKRWCVDIVPAAILRIVLGVLVVFPEQPLCPLIGQGVRRLVMCPSCTRIMLSSEIRKAIGFIRRLS